MSARGGTIAALATGRPPSAIAIIRISGASAFDAAVAVAGGLPLARRAGMRRFRSPQGVVLDHGLVLAFPAPDSATGEDVVELHCHGGAAVIDAVLGAVSSQPGVRLAEAGEFTRRAFENGRIDLTQAEGLADLLAATTEAQRAQAMAASEGALGAKAAEWQAGLLELLAEAEADLDFADEEDVPASIGDDGRLRALTDAMTAAAAQFERAERVRDGLAIVISGPPNAGKSSLLNALVGREAAIVSDRAGTTRDPVEVAINLGGLPATLVDTAGIRESSDHIELEGIARARERVERADLVLLMGEPATDSRTVQVRSRIDLDGCPPGFIDGVWHVSARTGAGVGELLTWLSKWAHAHIGSGEPALVTQSRQKAAIQDAVTACKDAAYAHGPVLRAENLRLAVQALARLTGRIDVEAVLDAIFARFCIGK